MRWPLALVLAACSGSDDGPTTRVLALAGEIQVEPGTTAVSHRADGSVIDQQLTDGSGHAILKYEPGAYVSVVYIRDTTQIVTTPALATGELVIRGPKPAKAPIIAGSLAITAPAITADSIAADLGCATVGVATIPTTIGIAAACFGTDSQVDVLVRATTGDAVVGYAAARVPIVNGTGMLDIAAWETTPTPIPVSANELGAVIDLAEISDGFAFETPASTSELAAWTGLIADSSRIRAHVAGQTTTAYVAGLPDSIGFAATDFLPATTSHVTTDRAKLAFTWDPLAVGDVVDLRAVWMPATGVIEWDAVLPPDATAIALPDIGFAAPAATDALTTELRAIDGPDTTTFADVQAAGLWVDQVSGSTIVPAPLTGLVRETSASF